MIPSWKTTLCGAIAALGTYLETVAEPTWLPVIGKVLVMAGAIGLGLFAKDHDVTGGDKPNVETPPVK